MNTLVHSLPGSDRRALHEHALALRRHLQECRSARGPWLDAAIAAEWAHALIAPRFVTTVTVVTVLLALLLGTL